jgi:serine/threonine protein kinase
MSAVLPAGKALDTACNASYKGTVDYSSLRSLAGYPNTPLDDLFSLGDCMLEMLLGDLPWDVCKEVEDNKQYNRSTITTTTKGAGGSPKQNLPWPQNVLPQLAAAKEAAVARCLQQVRCWSDGFANSLVALKTGGAACVLVAWATNATGLHHCWQACWGCVVGSGG